MNTIHQQQSVQHRSLKISFIYTVSNDIHIKLKLNDNQGDDYGYAFR